MAFVIVLTAGVTFKQEWFSIKVPDLIVLL